MITPLKSSSKSKKKQVEEMFDQISGKYDFLNHFLSMGIDHSWRKKAISLLKEHKPEMILDIATGTGDLALEALKLKPKKIVGLDLSEGMLNIGRKKIEKAGVSEIISLQKGDSENLEFEDNMFDAITVSFGVRNFENLEKGLSEMYRVLKPGGKVVILEFSKPQKFPVKQLYNFYFRRILPLWGKMFSKNQTAYSYLPESVKHFPDGQDFLNILNKTGFKDTKCQQLTLGICSVYQGLK